MVYPAIKLKINQQKCEIKSKDVNVSNLPRTLFENNFKIGERSCLQNSSVVWSKYATFFYNKFKNIIKDIKIDSLLYNGVHRVTAQSDQFMDIESIKECILSLKVNISEGFDHIPQHVLVDVVNQLLKPISRLWV